MSIAVLLRSRRLVKEAPVAWPCQLLIKTKCGLIEQISRPPSRDYPLSIRLCAKICEEERNCPAINSDLSSFLVFITSHIYTGWRLTRERTGSGQYLCDGRPDEGCAVCDSQVWQNYFKGAERCIFRVTSEKKCTRLLQIASNVNITVKVWCLWW